MLCFVCGESLLFVCCCCVFFLCCVMGSRRLVLFVECYCLFKVRRVLLCFFVNVTVVGCVSLFVIVVLCCLLFGVICCLLCVVLFVFAD